MGLLHLLKTILGVSPFVILCLLSGKINLSKANRSRQFLMPVIAFVYCVICVVILDDIQRWISMLFTWLGQHFSILNNISWQSSATIIFNILFVLGFVVIKAVVLPIVSAVWKLNGVAQITSELFYDYEEDVDKWLLKPSLSDFRGYMKGIHLANLFASSLVFAIGVHYPKAAFLKTAFYPAFGVIVLGECVHFLSGMTKTEFIEDILGEDEESYKIANYGMLRGILRELFSERVLFENTCDTSDGISSSFDQLDEMLQSEDPSLKMIGSYYQKLKDAGEDIDLNYVKSSVNLLSGKSTLFCNPFYRDLTSYILLPMIKQLISYRKCLIVLGRDSALDDVKDWIDTGLRNFSSTDSLWQSKVLDKQGCDSDVGLIKFSDIHNLEIHKANKDFLKKVGFVFIVEPSRILASGQVGLGLLVNSCEKSGKEIVYCACDRNCDGLVDALSHLLKTSITEVTATITGGGNNSQMYWNADGEYMHHKIFPNISRYLGVGTEINVVAMKYQLDQTGWVGCEKFPVSDMKWIAGQYHKQICAYADLPENQASFDRAFHVHPNLWSTTKKENSFLVVEDEFQNLFEITRVFSSRAKSQGFINVISENYLLRDYMLDNVDVFMADPKAIPTIVPDYARTERNMVLKLIMMMAYDSVSEERVAKELMLCGIQFEDPYVALKSLIVKHCNIEDASLSVRFREELQNDSLNSITVKYYEIDETNELYEYSRLLKNAYYIAEDEEGESHYIGAKLYGHVFQAMLPGQFMTFDGKYYEVQTVTPLNGVVVRRAADHITGRRYYRQIRRCYMNNWTDGSEMGCKRTLYGIELTRGYANVSVETDGYLEMDSYGDLARAKKVLLNGIPARNYRNKSVLKIKLPEKGTKQICYTICLLLNEIFRTTYPEMHHYVTALVPYSEEILSENLSDAMYRLEGECEKNCIYIVEDSDIDLGLIVSVERNLKRYFEIVADVLDWHCKKMLEKPPVEKEEVKEEPLESEDEPEEKRKGLLRFVDSLKGFFRKLFGKNKGDSELAEKENEEVSEENQKQESTDSSETDVEERESFIQKIKRFFKGIFLKKKEEPDLDGDEQTLHSVANRLLSEVESGSDDTEVVDDIDGEDEELADGETELTEYQKKCFIKFGYKSVDEILDIDGTRELLEEIGFDKNPLQQVRKAAGDIGGSDGDYDPHKYGTHLCDFCGVELLGGEYTMLKDGRERCNRCSMTAVKKVDDFRALYKTVLRNMEAFYGIKLNVAVRVRTTNAKKIAKHVGVRFVATPGFDGRVLGFAKKDKSGYSLYIENGSPKLAAAATIAHELTHIWQYLNWDDAELTKKYGKKRMLEVYEGMAKWAEIQYLMLLNEKAYAKRQEITTRLRDDEYGRGFLAYVEKYPLTDGSKVGQTPFKENPPL